jgi:hypothetical protein
MARFFNSINNDHINFIGKQKMFFVATAPLSVDGHVNLSPKGLDSFLVLSSNKVAYMDIVGSGNETSAHILENGRQIIVANIYEVSTSCGFGVPLYEYTGEREHSQKWAESKGPEGLETYKQQKNLHSLDGLPTALSVKRG